jgi:hypothetical protein
VSVPFDFRGRREDNRGSFRRKASLQRCGIRKRVVSREGHGTASVRPGRRLEKRSAAAEVFFPRRLRYSRIKARKGCIKTQEHGEEARKRGCKAQNSCFKARIAPFRTRIASTKARKITPEAMFSC